MYQPRIPILTWTKIFQTRRRAFWDAVDVLGTSFRRRARPALASVIRRIVELGHGRSESVREPDRVALPREAALHVAVSDGLPRHVVALLSPYLAGRGPENCQRVPPGAAPALGAVPQSGRERRLPRRPIGTPRRSGSRNSQGMTPLQVGIDVAAPMEIIKLMLERQPLPGSIRDRSDDGRLPVHFAARGAGH